MRRYLPELDGVRAVAIALVVCEHTGITRNGYLGVDIFFVLSGFLITSILLWEHENNRWSIKQFYLRRARRLYPGLSFLLVLVLLAAPPAIAGTGWHKVLVLFMCATYLSDVVTSVHFGWLGGLTHTWSLAIEEQFYLIWPVVLKNLDRRRIAVVAAVCMCMFALLTAGPGWLLFLPFSRGAGLLMGCLLAFLLQGHRVRHPDFVVGISVAALALIVLSRQPVPGGITGPPNFAPFGMAVATVGLIAGLVEGAWVSRAFSSLPLQWIGKRSYGIYLWHVPIGWYVFHGYAVNPKPTLAHVAIIGGGATLMAAVSYRFVERPFRHPNPASKARPTRHASHDAVGDEKSHA